MKDLMNEVFDRLTPDVQSKIVNIAYLYDEKRYYEQQCTELINELSKEKEKNCKVSAELCKEKEKVSKAIEYIKNKGGYCKEYKLTSRPFNTLELDELLDILGGNE